MVPNVPSCVFLMTHVPVIQTASSLAQQRKRCYHVLHPYQLRQIVAYFMVWTASSEFGTYRLCEQRRFRRACASAQSHQNLRCSLIQTVNQEEPSDRKPDPWPLWMAGHAQLKFVMTECSKTQIRLTGLVYWWCLLQVLILSSQLPWSSGYGR